MAFGHIVFYPRTPDLPSQPGSPEYKMADTVEAIPHSEETLQADNWVLALLSTQAAITEYLQLPIQLPIALPGPLPPQTALQAEQLETVTYACKPLPTMFSKTAIL